MNKIENQQPSSSAPQETSAVAATVASGSRRRLLRGGLVAAPTLLALTTTPVLACNCKLPSGFTASGNFSQTGSYNCAAPGTKPTSWKSMVDAQGKFNNTGVSKTTTFASVFGGTDTTSFFALFCLTGANNDARALAAAVYLQSIVNGGYQFPYMSLVQKMWTDTEGSGRFTAVTAPVVTWTRADVVVYFKYLTGLSI
ncbi:MAG: hypothetical protein CFE41_15095 [Burkholderiales bacterium PBB2]|nr:MAG: hypothetical protein CFE41_15095 [Burkholderiales bacterium PBB2]